MSDFKSFNRRGLLGAGGVALLGGFVLRPKVAWAKTYSTVDEARAAIWGDKAFTPAPVELTKEQMKAIKAASNVRVRNKKINAHKAEDGSWFVIDQVIGKHEYIDYAVGIGADGSVAGLEVLEYRESYGHEIIHPKWRAQFKGRGPSDELKLDREIQNISGATLSCRHVTDGVNRLTRMWDIALRAV